MEVDGVGDVQRFGVHGVEHEAEAIAVCLRDNADDLGLSVAVEAPMSWIGAVLSV